MLADLGAQRHVRTNCRCRISKFQDDFHETTRDPFRPSHLESHRSTSYKPLRPPTSLRLQYPAPFPFAIMAVTPINSPFRSFPLFFHPLPPSHVPVPGKEAHGRYMLQVPWSKVSGWGQPRITPRAEIAVDPLSGVTQYAVTCFEGMKVGRMYSSAFAPISISLGCVDWALA